MATREPPLTLGVEEEYLLIDRATGAVASEPPAELFANLHDRTQRTRVPGVPALAGRSGDAGLPNRRRCAPSNSPGCARR